VRNKREVLLGVRSADHVFMPHMYVFPGGRVDAGDARVNCPVDLRPVVKQRLLRTLSPARARALAMTAVRETWEETGLLLGHPCREPLQTRSPHWRPFFAEGVVPALDRLDYVARAITPPGQVRRYDARFFLADAAHASGVLRGNGELEDLRWVDINEAHQLALSPITAMVLELLEQRIRGKVQTLARVPSYRERNGRTTIDYE
jgi:8-oxo-dGTP pyrophosphatase MutT (NUDIX family)